MRPSTRKKEKFPSGDEESKNVQRESESKEQEGQSSDSVPASSEVNSSSLEPSSSFHLNDSHLEVPKNRNGTKKSNKTKHTIESKNIQKDSTSTDVAWLDKCPPNFELAQIHGEASLVKHYSSCKNQNNDVFCKCCDFPTFKAAPPFKLCVDVRELKILGNGFPLYFYYKLFTIFVLLWWIILVSIPAIVINRKANTIDKGVGAYVDGEDPIFLVHPTLGNHGGSSNSYNDGDEIDFLIMLNCIFLVVFSVLSMLFDRHQLRMDSKLDEENITAGDFTVLISNLPLDTNEDEIQSWLRDQHNVEGIRHTIMCYNIRTILEKNNEYIEARELRSYLIAKRLDTSQSQQGNDARILRETGMSRQDAEKLVKRNYFCIKSKLPSIPEMNNRIEKLESELETLKSKINSDDSKEGKFCGKAFVTFNNQNDAEDIVKNFRYSMYKRCAFYILFKIFRCKKCFESGHRLRGKRVRVRRAAEPTDIYWKNIPIKTSNRVCKSIGTYLVMTIILAASFVLNYILGTVKNSLEKDAQSSNDSVNVVVYILLFLISLGNSFITSCINFGLEAFIKKISKSEKHATFTAYNLTVAIKLILATFINTGLIPFFVNFRRDDWFTRSGLVVDVFFNTLAVCFISPLIYMFGPTYLRTQCIIRRERKKGEKSRYTQRQMNMLYEGQQLSVANRYSSATLLLMMCAFYVTLIPYLPIICIFGAIYQYWIEKWMLIRRHKIPERMDSYIEAGVRKLLPVIVFLYGIGQFIFIGRLSNHKNATVVIIMWITFSYMFLPFWLISHFCVRSVRRKEEDNYDNSYRKFKPDYIDLNPVEFIEVGQSEESEEEESKHVSRPPTRIKAQRRSIMNFSKLLSMGAVENMIEKQQQDRKAINMPQVNNILFKRRVSQFRDYLGHPSELDSLESSYSDDQYANVSSGSSLDYKDLKVNAMPTLHFIK